MDAGGVPQVIDYARQARIKELVDESGPGPFSMFNILAIVVLAIAAFFLYKRYKDKQATERAHMIRPSPIIAVPSAEVVEAAPVVEEVKTD
jgi:hypothetical protein